MSSWVLAIDYGTSNTAAAIRTENGTAQAVRLTPATDTMPSAVLRTPDGYRVGAAARHSQLTNPTGYLECPKLELGRPTVLLGGDEVEVADVVAETLRYVTAKAVAVAVAGGEPPSAVVLTHPQEWASRRRAALRAAWDRVGLDVGDVRLVPEPVAAVSWFANVAEIPDGGSVAVFDYGGGTCDVAVLRRRTGGATADGWPFEILAHAGRDALGGNALDVLLLGHVRRQLAERGEDALLHALEDPRSTARSAPCATRCARPRRCSRTTRTPR